MAIEEQIEQAAREYATHYIDTKETDFYGKFIQEKGCDPAEERGFIAGARWAVDNLKSTWIKYKDEKPEPKYRPFKTQEECWNEMLKHQPFGFLSIADKHDYFSICRVFEEEGKPKIWLTNNAYGDCDMTTAFVIFQFIDGTPFGIREE